MGQEQSNVESDSDNDAGGTTEKSQGSKRCRHISLISVEHDLRSFMKDFAFDIKKGSLPSMRGRVLIFLDLQAYTTKVKCLPAQILLGHLFADDTDPSIPTIYDWMIRNQKKVVFLIYSLDTYPYDLEWKKPRIQYFKPTSADIVIHNLLSSNLFPDSIIISSTAQKKFENLHVVCHPDHFLEVEGVNESSEFAITDIIDDRNPQTRAQRLHKNIWPLLGSNADRAMKAFGRTQSSGRTSLGSDAGFQITDLEEKRRHLTEELAHEIHRTANEKRRLDLLLSVYEGGEKSTHIIREHMKSFVLSDVTLSSSDCVALSFLIGLAKELHTLDFRNCGLNFILMEKLAKHILDSQVKIHKLDLSCNDIPPRGMLIVGRIIKHCHIKNLVLYKCGLSELHLQKLLTVAGECRVNSLDVSYNNLGPEGMLFLGKMVRQWNVKALDMNNCGAKPSHLGKFFEATGIVMFDELDISEWEQCPKFSPILVDFMTRVRKKMSIFGWQISPKERRALQDKLNKISKVLTVFMSGGIEMTAEESYT